MEYLGWCLNCRGLVVVVAPGERHTVLQRSVICHCSERDRQIADPTQIHRPPERKSVVTVRRISDSFRYTVRHIPALAKMPDRFERAALATIRYAETVRRLFRPSRYRRILGEDIVDPPQ